MPPRHASRRLLLHGIRPARVVPDLLGRPRHPRRRLHQVRARPPAAPGGRRPAVGARLLRAAHRRRRPALRGVPGLHRRLPRRTPACACASGCAATEVQCRVWVTEKFGHMQALPHRPDPPRGPLDHAPALRGGHRHAHRAGDAAGHRRRARAELARLPDRRSTTSTRGTPCSADIEMIAEHMESGMQFPQAWERVRKKIVFTTHTPVRAGNEEHALKDLRRMGACLQLSGAEMRAIGGDPFNMTVAGLRLSRAANAVAQLHGETARVMWAGVENAAPIGAITNGVHQPTWQIPGHPRRGHRPRRGLDSAPRVQAGAPRRRSRRRHGVALEEDALLIGFARRAASYKRSDLILRDETRLAEAAREGTRARAVRGQGAPRRRDGPQHRGATGPGRPQAPRQGLLPRELRHGARAGCSRAAATCG